MGDHLTPKLNGIFSWFFLQYILLDYVHVLQKNQAKISFIFGVKWSPVPEVAKQTKNMVHRDRYDKVDMYLEFRCVRYLDI